MKILLLAVNKHMLKNSMYLKCKLLLNTIELYLNLMPMPFQKHWKLSETMRAPIIFIPLILQMIKKIKTCTLIRKPIVEVMRNHLTNKYRCNLPQKITLIMYQQFQQFQATFNQQKFLMTSSLNKKQCIAYDTILSW